MIRKKELMRLASKRGFHDGYNQQPASPPTKCIMRGNKSIEIEASHGETDAYFDAYRVASDMNKKGIMKPRWSDSAKITGDLFCKDCGWPVVDACCNDEMGKLHPESDWWYYCSNQGCKNHPGTDLFDADWAQRIKGKS